MIFEISERGYPDVSIDGDGQLHIEGQGVFDPAPPRHPNGTGWDCGPLEFMERHRGLHGELMLWYRVKIPGAPIIRHIRPDPQDKRPYVSSRGWWDVPRVVPPASTNH